jgi:hypothetical protein
MLSELHNFLMLLSSYGQGKSERIERIVDEQMAEVSQYLFGQPI